MTGNGNDDEGGKWNEDNMAGRPSTSTRQQCSQGWGHPPLLQAPACRVDGGVLMFRKEGVGWTPPHKPMFTRGFSLFNYSYRPLPPSHDKGRGNLYHVGCPTLPHPLWTCVCKGFFQIIQQVIVHPQPLHLEGRGNLYFTPPLCL